MASASQSSLSADDDVDENVDRHTEHEASERAALQADDRETATSAGVSEMIPLHDVDDGRRTETNYVHDVVGATTTESRTDEDSDDLSDLADEKQREQLEQLKQRMSQLKTNENFEDEETIQFLRYVDSFVSREPAERITHQLRLLVKCGVVELVQKMWRRYLTVQLLEHDDELPTFIHVWMKLIWTLSDDSDEVCERIITTGFHEDMLSNLSWDALSVDRVKESQSRRKICVVEAHINTLHNVVRRVHAARAVFRQCRAVDVVHKFRDLNEHPDIVVVTLMMQSYLVTKGEVRKLNADQQVFTWLVAVLDCAVRTRPWHGRTFAAIEVLKALNNLSVTEENKLRIIEAGALPHYVKLLSVDREEAEQLAAAQGLCKLASTHKDRITRQRGCLKALRKLEKNASSDEVRKKATGALCILENRDQEQNGEKLYSLVDNGDEQLNIHEGEYTFPEGTQAEFVVVGKEEQHSEEVVESVWEKLVERKSISLIVSILCDVRFISANEGQLQRIASNLVDAAAGGLFRTCITTGGRNNAVTRYIGRAVRDNRAKESTVHELTTAGFVDLSKLTSDTSHEQTVKERMKHICRDLEPHHEHFVLYEGDDNDDDFRARFHKLHSSVPVETVLMGGGFESLKSACQSVESKVPLLVIAGTGPAADFIANAFNGHDQQLDEHTARRLFDVDDARDDAACIDMVKRMLAMRQWLTVCTIDEISSKIVVKTLCKSYGYKHYGKIEDIDDWYRCAHLAIDENLYKYARKGIYNDANRHNWSQGDVLFDHLERALSRNKCDMAQVLVEKIEEEEEDLTRFIELRLIQLYSDTFTVVNLYSPLRDALRTLLRRLHHQITSDAEDESYWDVDCLHRALNELTNGLYDEQNKDEPYRELFVWAVFFNRMSLANFFWRKCPNAIGSALVASKLCKSLAKQADSPAMRPLAEELKANAREFETGAYTVLDRLSEKSQVASDALLTRELLAWGKKKNMFTLAESVGGADFVNSNCCQTKLDKTWIGETKPSTSALAILACLVCPLLIPILKTVKKDDSYMYDDDEELNAAEEKKRFVVQTLKNIVEFYRAPKVKYCSHLIAYLLFLAFYSYVMTVKLSPGSPSVFEVIVWIWAATIWSDEIRQMADAGFIRYLRDRWNMFDQAMYALLVVAVILRFTLTEESDFTWARNVYVVSLVMFYLRILELYLIHLQLGPKIVMIGRMLKELMYFGVVACVFLFAYGVAMQSLLYPNSERAWWSILYSVFSRPYLSIFEEFDLDELAGGVEGCSDNSTVYLNDPDVPRCPRKSWLVMALFFVYMLITAIMLVNLLIAIFSKTVEDIQQQDVNTWRFYRIAVILEYENKPSLAPPLIVINHLFKICCCACDRKRRSTIRNRNRQNALKWDKFEQDGVKSYLNWKQLEEKKHTQTIDSVLQRLDVIEKKSDLHTSALERLDKWTQMITTITAE